MDGLLSWLDSSWVWIVTIVVLIAILAVDLLIIGRRPHEPSMKEATLWISFFVGLAVVFGVGVLYFEGTQAGTEFFAGWLTEYSLSVDNLFVFIIIMSRFSVPRQYQQTALLIGIVLALVMRGIFIGLGAAAINQWAWVFYIFGAFLIYTAIGFARHGQEDEEEFKENPVIGWAKRNLPATSEYNGIKLTVVENGKRLLTPMALVIIALGTTDLLFALDSIPAIYGLTKDPYLVFTANVFALMGLRQLYFLIGGLLQRLVYLSVGLAVILGFIGIKLILHALHENNLPFVNGGQPVPVPEVNIFVSLGVIVGTIVVTTIASLWRSSRQPERQEANRTT
ncbi:MAG TPA: TerC family protein [Actinopolymorphaceae bacterium]